MSLAEGIEERIGDDVVGCPVAQPPGNVTMQDGSVPVIEPRERLGVTPGPLDQRGVVRGLS